EVTTTVKHGDTDFYAVDSLRRLLLLAAERLHGEVPGQQRHRHLEPVAAQVQEPPSEAGGPEPGGRTKALEEKSIHQRTSDPARLVAGRRVHRRLRDRGAEEPRGEPQRVVEQASEIHPPG